MSDPALNALFDHLRDCKGAALLVADEQLDCAALLQLKVLPNLTVLTNRFDVAQCAQQAGITSIFNDMDLAACGQTFALIGYRVSKEKAVVHHVINQVPYHLQAGGELILTGYKDEGTKTYISKAEQYLGCRAQVTKGERQLQIASLTPATLSDPLDDRGYQDWHTIAEIHQKPVYSKPGQYGWNKLDEGSKQLINCLQQQISMPAAAPASALDLGCGYGYLALMTAYLGVPRITATDNNAAAIASCQRNFAEHGIHGDVIADNCGQTIHHQFELVVCNPPFHRGFDTEASLTEQFAASAAHHLKSGGYALFVVNQFIPLETIAAPYFKAAETLFRDKSFKVLKLSC